MDDSNPRIPEAIAPKIYQRAAQLYAQRSQDYSLAELIQAGEAAQIPPEYIRQAVQQIQTKRAEAKQRQQRLKLIFVTVAAMATLWSIWTYNRLISAAQKVDAAWAQVENQLQRRADLIPDLVWATQLYTHPEPNVVTQLERAWQTYEEAKGQPEKIAASQEVNQAIDQLHSYANFVPQVWSVQLSRLLYELPGTENRIAVEQMRYNQAVQAYNHQVKSFPSSVLAGVFGFRSRLFLHAEEN